MRLTWASSPCSSGADGVSLGGGVILTGNERPLKEDAPSAAVAVGAAGVKQLRQGPAAGRGHKGGAGLIGGGVERDGKVDRPVVLRQAQDAGDHADGRQGDVARTDGQAVVVGEDVDGGHGVVVVVERFAHAHEDDIAQAVAFSGEDAPDVEHLGHDFARGEMAGEAHLPGGAEDAAHGAADLGGDAGGVPAGELHDDRFDGLTVRQSQQVFARQPVAAAGFQRDRQRLQRRPLRQLGQQLRAHVGQIGKGGGPVAIEPAEDALGVVARNPPRGELVNQRCARQVVEIGTLIHRGLS